MSWPPFLPALVVLGLVGAGCASEQPAQRAARGVVERHVLPLPEYDSGDIHCTGNPRPWFVEQEANVYICAVGRDDGDCDWFRVTVSNGEAAVVLESRRAGCVLPA